MHHSRSRLRAGRWSRAIVPAAVAAGCLLAAPAALADTIVSRENGDFGVGRGEFLHIRDARSVVFDTRIDVDVSRDGGEIVVTDAVGAVRTNEDTCVRQGAQVRCSAAGLTGLKLEGSTENDVIENRTNLLAEILGDGGNDLLIGGSERDRINGEAGNDTERGGGGADIFRAEPGNDVLDGQAGDVDTVSYAGASGPISVSLGGGQANDGVAGERDNLLNVENAIGSAFVDSMSGSEGPNVLRGGAERDTIRGGGGDDVLDGQAGGDIIDGQAGNDTADYSGRSAAVSVSINGIADDGNADDDGARDNVSTSTDNVDGGRGNDNLLGSGSPNRLNGAEGSDTLNGGKGADVFVPGPGSDTVSYADDPRDARLAAVQITLDGLANDGSFQDDAADGSRDNVPADTEVVRGTAFGDVLAGSDAANTLEGGGGDDTIRGLGGSDLLNGQGGADALDGGNEPDRLRGGDGGDLMAGGASADTAEYGDHAEGVTVTLDGVANDGLQGSAPENDNVQTEHVSGTERDDLLTGDAGSNLLRGLGGADRLEGGGGADRLEGGAGNDELHTNDAVLDTPIDCGGDIDKAFADLVDQAGAIIADCETVFVAAVGELPNVDIVDKSLRIDRRGRALLRLHCPADVKTAGCHGQLAVQALSKAGAAARGSGAARRYGLRRGQRAKVALKLSRRLTRTLKRRGKVLATAREKDRTGRAKTTSKVLAVRARR